MAISFSTDIILDVARAADPELAATARAKLGATRNAGTEVFRAEASLSKPAPAALLPELKPERPEAHVKFEAMVLQTFLQSMLPSGTEDVYGGGLAGDMWKSMLAEQMSGVMAERGGIGIADRILADYTIENETKVALGGHTPGNVAEASGDKGLLTKALVEEMQRKLLQAVRQDAAAIAITTPR